MDYEIVKIDKIKPLEMVFPHHLDNLSKMILDKGIIYQPLIVDDKHYIVLDGSHRYVFLLREGFNEVPIIKVHYFDENVRVGTHLKHRYLDDGEINISKNEVILRGTNGILFPPRTTRHFFTFRKYWYAIHLKKLKRGEPRDVSRYIADAGLQEEIEHNENYIREIEEEREEIELYIDEQEKTRDYLTKQIEMMKKWLE